MVMMPWACDLETMLSMPGREREMWRLKRAESRGASFWLKALVTMASRLSSAKAGDGLQRRPSKKKRSMKWKGFGIEGVVTRRKRKGVRARGGV